MRSDTGNCSAKNTDLYASKVILAPMVRAGRTPLRTLALDYGADLAYTEEIVDQKLLGSQRIENAYLGTVDYILGDEVVLRVATEEKAKCVLQIGTNSAENAAKICQQVGKDVAAIDVNMGCPKPFSVHAGMGAALLGQPDKAKEILTTMVSVSPVPVSCKIRVLDSPYKTMEFARMVEQCGVSALGVHGRRREERPRHQCREDDIRDCARLLSIPVIANGGSKEIRSYEDIARFRRETGASSVMLARRAFSHPSIFRPDGLLAMEEQIEDFLHKACQYDECYTAVKYVVQRILGSQQEFDPRGRQTVAACTVREICRVWGVEDAFTHVQQKKISTSEHDGVVAKRPRNCQNDGDGASTGAQFRWVEGVRTAPISFPPRRLKGAFQGRPTPRCVLNAYCRERRLPPPSYQNTKQPGDGRFLGAVCVNGHKFGSTVSQPNIKLAEQVAALVALHGLEIRHRLEGDWEEGGTAN